MKIGVPKEVKANEYRVGLLPVGAQVLAEDGHEVWVEKGAGVGCGFTDKDYEAAGAHLVDTAQEVFEKADLVIKVKEPQPSETNLLRPHQILFTYFHFAASRELTEKCLASGVTAVAYETVEDGQRRLPLLTPMSEVAGRMAAQEGAKYLEKPFGGRGILLGGVPGVEPAEVLVLGGGVVGSNAARIAAGMGAQVAILDVNIERLRYLSETMPANVRTAYCDPHTIERHVERADLIIGAVLVPGARAPKLLRREHLARMKENAVVVDVCIDQGGCCETARPTTHGDPVYLVDGVLHYCVANMPGAVGSTSARALCNATLPYARDLAGRGLEAFLTRSAGHSRALNMQNGTITHKQVAEAFPDLPAKISSERMN